MSTPTLSVKSAFSPIYEIFNREQKARAANIFFRAEVVIHTPDADFTAKDGIILREMIINRDFENNIGDHIEVRLAIPLGTFTYEIFDRIENTELTVRMQKQYHKKAQTLAEARKKRIVGEDRYKLVFLKDKNMEIPNIKVYSKDDLNQRLPAVITCQLILRPVESIRIKTVSGNFGKARVTPDVFIKTLMSTETNHIKIDGKPPLDLIEIQKADCEDIVRDLTFNSHTRVIEVPDYIQVKSVGIYNSGMGCYIQKHYSDYETYKTGFWMFSLYDPDKKERVSPDYMIYCPETTSDSSSYPASTFDESTKMLFLLAQRVLHIDDTREVGVMSGQSGFRIGNSTKMLSDRAFTITDKGPEFSKTKLSTEMVYKERDDGVQHSTNHGNYANDLHLTSDVMKRQAKFITLLFNNLDHEVITPGKTVGITYYGDNAELGTDKKMTITRHALLISGSFRYAITDSNPVSDLNAKQVDMGCVAELRFCIGKMR